MSVVKARLSDLYPIIVGYSCFNQCKATALDDARGDTTSRHWKHIQSRQNLPFFRQTVAACAFIGVCRAEMLEDSVTCE